MQGTERDWHLSFHSRAVLLSVSERTMLSRQSSEPEIVPEAVFKENGGFFNLGHGVVCLAFTFTLKSTCSRKTRSS